MQRQCRDNGITPALGDAAQVVAMYILKGERQLSALCNKLDTCKPTEAAQGGQEGKELGEGDGEQSILGLTNPTRTGAMIIFKPN